MKEIICGIYKITSPSGKIYIGQSVNCNKRKSVYKYGSPNQPKLNHSIKKYGFNSHLFEVIFLCDESDLNKWEVYYGELFDCRNPEKGLNTRECGGSKGRHSEESNRKNSESHKRNHANGYISPNKGKPHSEAARQNMSKSQKARYLNGEPGPRKGKKASVETIEKMRIASTGNKYCLGRIQPPETLKKISKASKKTWDKRRISGNMSQAKEHRDKRISKIIGSKRSEETKLKMRKPRSEQGKENMRIGQAKFKLTPEYLIYLENKRIAGKNQWIKLKNKQTNNENII